MPWAVPGAALVELRSGSAGADPVAAADTPDRAALPRQFLLLNAADRRGLRSSFRERLGGALFKVLDCVGVTHRVRHLQITEPFDLA